MREPSPIDVLDLFPEERNALLNLLNSFSAEEWSLPTICAGWSVREVALHILGGDISNISRRRDSFQGLDFAPGEDLVTFLNRANEEWVRAARRFSPQVILDFLRLTGPLLDAYWNSLDLNAIGGGVSWAGLDRAPVWLDVAREYTEHWMHQQHIRDAVGKPGLTDRRFMGPVLQAFAFALPVALRDYRAQDGTSVQFHVDGEAGGDWTVVRRQEGWKLYTGSAAAHDARVDIDQATAWQFLTKGLSPEQARRRAHVSGDEALGATLLSAVAIIG